LFEQRCGVAVRVPQSRTAGDIIHDATTGNNYSFDPENRIIGAAGFTYTYDADGARVMKSNGSTGTIYWDMIPGIVAESDLSGNLQHLNSPCGQP